MKISIILPTYKPTLLLRKCLASIAEQTFENYELIIVLNGCRCPFEDKISVWLKELSIEKKTHLIQIDTPGVSNARNIGLEYSTGEYICFIDDDDIISSNYLENLYSLAAPDTIVFSNVKMFIYDIGNELPDNPYEKAFISLSLQPDPSMFHLRKLLNGPWGKLFPRKLIGKTCFNTLLTHGEDAMFNFELSKNFKFSKFSPYNVIYYYRINSNGTANKKVSIKYAFIQFFRKEFFRTKIYISSPLKYNILFFISRFFADCQYLFHQLCRK